MRWKLIYKIDPSPVEPGDFCPYPLTSEVVRKLKSMSGSRLPLLRPSLQSVICPDALEEKIVTVVVKHMGLAETVRNIGEQVFIICHFGRYDFGQILIHCLVNYEISSRQNTI
jgi:hypothetical protein